MIINIYGQNRYIYSHGAIIRGDTAEKKIAIVFTGGDYNDGGWHIRKTLKAKRVPASFFFTGDFYRNHQNKTLIQALIKDGHYLGAHSDKHLQYCDWNKRDSLLVSKSEFITDLENNYKIMAKFGLSKNTSPLFLPPYEWYNEDIARWAEELGLVLINFTPGTLSHTDYTLPYDRNYRDSATIWQSIVNYEQKSPNGLNGFILLLHIGTHPDRTDKFYLRLNNLIDYLISKNYRLVRIDELLKEANPYARTSHN